MSKSVNKQVITKQTVSSSVSPSKNSKKNKSRSANSSAKTMSKPVSVSIAVSAKATSRVPRQRAIQNGVEIDHTEFVMPIFKKQNSDVYADVDNLTQLARLRFNPGSKATFDWLSTVAPCYEFYKFKRLEFIYETRCSTTTEGSLILSPDYDAADAQAGLDEKSLFNNLGTTDDALWRHQRCVISVDSMNKLYKAHPNMSDSRFETSTQDEKTIDAGQLFVCIDSAEAAQRKYGKLFVKYVVQLTKPQQVTEPANLGGVSFISTTLLPNSTLPIPAPLNQSDWKIDSELLKSTTSLLNLTYPTATLGRFVRDFEGIVSTKSAGTGLASGPTYYVGSDPIGVAGIAGDVTQASSAVSGTINSVNTVSIDTHKIIAKVGDYLKIRTPTATTLTSIVLDMAGISSLSLR